MAKVEDFSVFSAPDRAASRPDSISTRFGSGQLGRATISEAPGGADAEPTKTFRSEVPAAPTATDSITTSARSGMDIDRSTLTSAQTTPTDAMERVDIISGAMGDAD